MRKRLGQRKQQFQEWQREFAKSWICHFSPKKFWSAEVFGGCSETHLCMQRASRLCHWLERFAPRARVFLLSGDVTMTVIIQVHWNAQRTLHSNVWTCPQLRVDWSNLSLLHVVHVSNFNGKWMQCGSVKTCKRSYLTTVKKNKKIKINRLAYYILKLGFLNFMMPNAPKYNGPVTINIIGYCQV